MNLNTIDELNDFVKNTMLYDQQASTVYSALHDKVSFAKELPQSVLDYYRDVVAVRRVQLCQELRHNDDHSAEERRARHQL